MKARKNYLDSIAQKLEKVTQDTTITKAAERVVQAIAAKKTLYTFGASHAGILSEELFYRAGGLALFNPIFDRNLMLDVKPVTKTSALEQMEGYGNVIASHIAFERGDLLIAHSVSGRNPVMIDLVEHAKTCGVYVIGITNVAYSKQTQSRHRSGLRLFELTDLTIDNHGEIGDATVQFDSFPQKVAPTSTVIGAAIVNSLLVEVVEQLLEQGIEPPVFFSANMDNTAEHNQKILDTYCKQIHYM